MTRSRNHNDMSIEDILKSIRDVISERSKATELGLEVEEDELCLTDVIVENMDEKESRNADEVELSETIIAREVSDRTKAILEDFAQTVSNLGHNINDVEEQATHGKTIENFLENILRPLMKDWLDANLPAVVKQVVSQEIKRLVGNINRNNA